jgi:hypothetical protein
LTDQFSDRERQKRLSQFRASQITFPTDRLTVSNIRALVPSSFEWKFEGENTYCDSDAMEFLDNALYYERLYAAYVFCETQQIDPKSTNVAGSSLPEKEDIFEMVDEIYRLTGIAKSTAETRSLVDDIEKQVVAQTREFRLKA